MKTCRFLVLIFIVCLLSVGCGAVKQDATAQVYDIVFDKKIFSPNTICPASDGSLLVADLNTGLSKLSIDSFENVNLDALQLKLPAAVWEWNSLYYIADYRNNRIVVIDQQGNEVNEWTDERMSDPEGVSIDSNGNVYVASYGNGYILKYDQRGNYLTSWNTISSAEDVLRHPHGIFVDAESVFVSELAEPQRVVEYDLEGNFVRQFGQEKQQWQLVYPTSLFIQNDLIYVADAVDCQIKIFDRQGNFKSSFGEFGVGGGQFYYPYGIGLDAQGNIYVGDTHNHRIQVFNSEYELVKVYTGNEQEYQPQSMATHEKPLKIDRASITQTSASADSIEVANGTVYGINSKSKQIVDVESNRLLLEGFCFPYSAQAMGDTLYVTDEPGSLVCYDVKTGLAKKSYSLTSTQFDATQPLSTFVYRFRDMAIEEDGFVIANTLPGNLLQFDALGVLQGYYDIKRQAGHLPRPVSVALLDSSIYYADMTGYVGVIDTIAGKHYGLSTPLGLDRPMAVEMDEITGLVAVVEPSQNRVQFWDAATMQWLGYINNSRVSGLIKPTDIGFDSALDTLYIACEGERIIKIANINKSVPTRDTGFTAKELPYQKTAQGEYVGGNFLFMELYGNASQKAINLYSEYKSSDGVVLYDYGFSWLNFELPVVAGYGVHPWPNQIAHYALLNHYTGGEEALRQQKLHADWLLQNAQMTSSGVAYWLNDYALSDTMLEPNFIAASTQALCAAALVKAAEHFPDEAEIYLQTAQNALKAFGIPTTTEGGVRAEYNDQVFFADYFTNEYLRYDVIPFAWTTAALQECGEFGSEYYESTLSFWKYAKESVLSKESDNYFVPVTFDADPNNSMVHMGASRLASKIIDYQQRWQHVTATSYCEGVEAKEINKLLTGQVSSLSIPSGSRIVLSLDGELELDSLEFQFDGTGFPVGTRIYTTDMIGQRSYNVIWESSAPRAEELLIQNINKDAAYLAIETSTGSTTTLLNRVVIKGTPTYPLWFQMENEVIMDAKDPNNPLSIWRLPMLKSYYTWADTILAGRGELTDHQKIILFMESMRNYKVGLNVSSPLVTITDRIGACGNYANVLAAMATTQNLPASIITLANYPKNAGHVVVEIEVDGKKCIYDPTYAAYYTTTPEDDKTPYVLSLEELQLGKGKEPNVTRVVGFPERVTTDMARDFLGPDIYERANPISVVNPANKLFYPLLINYNEDREITQDEYGTIYQGAEYIGAAAMNHSHIWRIDNLVPQKEYTFSIRGTFVGGELLLPDGSKDPTFPAYATIEDGAILQGANYTFDIGKGDSEWIIKFRADASTVSITLSHNFIGPEYHYVNTDRFMIE